MGILEVLGLVLITLKALGLTELSWFWVTLPLWGGLIITITVVALIFFLFFRQAKKAAGWQDRFMSDE